LIIVGLGNPGKQYEKTRHNAGFLALDFLAKKTEAGEWQDKQKFCHEIFAEFLLPFAKGEGQDEGSKSPG
jgi:PTH1 family peptidyl-tRNA hydrolase